MAQSSSWRPLVRCRCARFFVALLPAMLCCLLCLSAFLQLHQHHQVSSPSHVALSSICVLYPAPFNLCVPRCSLLPQQWQIWQRHQEQQMAQQQQAWASYAYSYGYQPMASPIVSIWNPQQPQPYYPANTSFSAHSYAPPQPHAPTRPAGPWTNIPPDTTPQQPQTANQPPQPTAKEAGAKPAAKPAADSLAAKEQVSPRACLCLRWGILEPQFWST